jgi:catechol 2,3-dioxygenase-like lactoylglutathione lyase family enzyme
MAVRLNHTIVSARDHHASARFLTEILGLPDPVHLGPFAIVQVGDTSLDFMTTGGKVNTQHYAFLVTELEFDEIFRRIRERGLTFWADPAQKKPGEINEWDGGRGVYWTDPNGHLLEVITRPYGAGGSRAPKPHPLLDASQE